MTDLSIAQSVALAPIKSVATRLGIAEDDLELYGKHKAKLPLALIDAEKMARAQLILVTAMTPTPAGEGKTTMSIGLSDGLNKLGKRAIAVLREPSVGPVFGAKGGATGGGHAQVGPLVDINLHFTGDFSAVEKANNLLASLIDNALHTPGHPLNLDPRAVLWKRVIDLNDRSLRDIIIGLGGKANGVMRSDGFNITAASEVMAILCLATSLADLKAKLGNILVGFTYTNEPVYARQLKAEAAMAILLRDALQPNLVQTLEGNPALVHGGPFANIAQGTNTVLATRMGLSLGDYVVTEAGFGADLGAEKFLNIKCGYAALAPAALVMVATIRALRHHGGAPPVEINTPDLARCEQGFANLEKHLENAQKFGFQPVVAINHFVSDTAEEVALVQRLCQNMGVQAVVSTSWAEGGAGATRLAEAVLASIASGANRFRPLYAWDQPIKAKIETIAREIYGAAGVDYSPKAEADIRRINRLGFAHLPICMAKTQKSFSDNEKLIGRPVGFRVTVREFELATGAGFVIPLLGSLLRMPGLPAVPASEGMDIDDDGVITGLS
ncbi:formate--tetrahydrofolate ligase [Hymenobacter terrestris]|uniref:Formate--tetrahydrofolate ligase n=1 Tax=Hymenobacter terrestris TaxID=2748310 RepID=A0ABX2Q382_9BACT|nr:formate--tetrahydrofolate ligase [Hymenobacter terrestris]NVO84466.1 formate--tetrahydrofolate ligase [Hymenobacter terrestris]